MEVVDVDDARTWPEEVSGAVAFWRQELSGTASCASDLEVPPEVEETFPRMFRGRLLRAYHATRLLPHEAVSIRVDGLRRLTAELVRDRIDAAEREGALGAPLAAKVRENHTFAKGQTSGRRDQVCCFLPASMLASDAGQLGNLPVLWGGEAIYMSAPADVRAGLSQLGVPAIVVVGLAVGEQERTDLYFPALARVFVGAALRLERRSCDVCYRADIPALQIERIAFPGDAWYDAYPGLPQR